MRGHESLFSVPCSVCGSSTLRVEFRDSFIRDPLVKFDPKANGMWVVCENGHESQPETKSIFDG